MPPPLPKRKSSVATAEDSSPPSSSAFGKFLLLASLGSGGMGDVSLAVTESSMGVKKLVVVKRLLLEHAEDPAAREMFIDEGRLSVRLNHPNVVQTYEVGVEKDAFFIAMEYLEGQPVHRVYSRVLSAGTPIPHTVWARIISDALRGLHYAHELADYDGTPLNIVHRDLSPQNLFITYDGVVKIVDFGIAKSEGQKARTQLGVIKGKVAYMAPEQVDPSNKIDRRADIFVLGIVLWELVTGHRLMKGNTVLQTFQRIAIEPSPRPSSLVAGVDPALDAIIARALEKRPEDRFQTAQEMRDALEEYIEAAGGAWAPDRLGSVVSELFDDQRTQVRAKIRAFMTAPAHAVDAEDLPQLSISEISEVTGLGRAGVTRRSMAVPPARMRVGARIALVAAAITTAAGLGTYVGRSLKPHQHDEHAASPVAATTGVVEYSPVVAVARSAAPLPARSAAAREVKSDDAAPSKSRHETRRWHPWHPAPVVSAAAPAPAPSAPAPQQSAAPPEKESPPEAVTAAPTATARGRKFRRTF